MKLGSKLIQLSSSPQDKFGELLKEEECHTFKRIIFEKGKNGIVQQRYLLFKVGLIFKHKGEPGLYFIEPSLLRELDLMEENDGGNRWNLIDKGSKSSSELPMDIRQFDISFRSFLMGKTILEAIKYVEKIDRETFTDKEDQQFNQFIFSQLYGAMEINNMILNIFAKGVEVKKFKVSEIIENVIYDDKSHMLKSMVKIDKKVPELKMSGSFR